LQAFNKRRINVKAKLRLITLGISLGALAASTGALAEQDVYPSHQVSGENKNANNVYLLRCSACHGANGEGTDHEWPRLAPALKGNPFVKNAPAAALINVIRQGRNGRQRLYHESYPNMPAFGAEAVVDVEGLVRFLKTDLQK
jgi:mono/diheme cytochrome c family protein